MSDFIHNDPSLASYWRAIILFGKNSASYKFALACSLLEILTKGKNFVRLDELAEPFSRNIIDHLTKAERQCTASGSKFLQQCRDFKNGVINRDTLLEKTVELGFVNVIDAFHVVNQREIPRRFFVDERKSRNGITITDDLFVLGESFQKTNFPHEVEARWRLVETAWSLNLPPRVLTVKYDPNIQDLFVLENDLRRVGVTSCRDALNGYQRGRCFYCRSEITVQSDGPEVAEVDHFFPWILKSAELQKQVNLDGIWNLVLSCKNCNRGNSGKFAQVPDILYLEHLHRRNNYLIDSHHPLRETLMAQTGSKESERAMFLQHLDLLAIEALIHRWKPKNEIRLIL